MIFLQFRFVKKHIFFLEILKISIIEIQKREKYNKECLTIQYCKTSILIS